LVVDKVADNLLLGFDRAVGCGCYPCGFVDFGLGLLYRLFPGCRACHAKYELIGGNAVDFIFVAQPGNVPHRRQGRCYC
jgi:hypothetical protein